MDKSIKSIYADDIENICMNLEKESQVFLCGLDKEVVGIVVKAVSTVFKKRGVGILDINQEEDMIKTKALCIMDIRDCTSLSKNKLLYFYLEQASSSSCKILMYSTDCSSLDSLERRVRSRFNDSTHFLRNLTIEEYKMLYKILNKNENNDEIIERQYKIFPSLDKLVQICTRSKYGIQDYSDILSIFNPIHLSILILSLRKKLIYNNVVREFKKATVKIKELKNVKDEEILFYYYDLLDFGLVSEKGIFLYSEIELKNFILERCPTYLKAFYKLQ
ncbi:hypothetical protein NGRA_0787 [Nosema granulosis]|uniref:Uncharacterized protein n=1 Tax=Nosema granulosis TaxID=83296 RepID=A0A9P6KZU2_9MICR|nr:hypothetical protein NGRA_0787 [Nosema granulosis]